MTTAAPREHWRLVTFIASRHERRFGLPIGSTWGVAWLAFEEARQSFDPGRGTFGTHVSAVIRHRLIDDFNRTAGTRRRVRVQFRGQVPDTPAAAARERPEGIASCLGRRSKHHRSGFDTREDVFHMLARGVTQEHASIALGVTQSAVSKAVKAMRLNYAEAEA